MESLFSSSQDFLCIHWRLYSDMNGSPSRAGGKQHGGHKEEMEPLSRLAPQTELSEARHLGVLLVVQLKEISIVF